MLNHLKLALTFPFKHARPMPRSPRPMPGPRSSVQGPCSPSDARGLPKQPKAHASLTKALALFKRKGCVMVWRPMLVHASTQHPRSSSTALVKHGLRASNLQCLKSTLLASPTMDIRRCTPQCYCEQLVTALLSTYLCDSHMCSQIVPKKTAPPASTSN